MNFFDTIYQLISNNYLIMVAEIGGGLLLMGVPFKPTTPVITKRKVKEKIMDGCFTFLGLTIPLEKESFFWLLLNFSILLIQNAYKDNDISISQTKNNRLKAVSFLGANLFFLGLINLLSLIMHSNQQLYSFVLIMFMGSIILICIMGSLLELIICTFRLWRN